MAFLLIPLQVDNLNALSSLGLTLPSPSYLIGSLIFGLIGYVAWRYGRRQSMPYPKWLGVALMFYPYAVSNTVAMYVIGVALTAAVWFTRV